MTNIKTALDLKGILGALKGIPGQASNAVAGIGRTINDASPGVASFMGKDLRERGMSLLNKSTAYAGPNVAGNARRITNALGKVDRATDMRTGATALGTGALGLGAAGYGAKKLLGSKPKQEEKEKEASAMNENEKVLFDEVYLPAFAEKLAAAGINVNDGEVLKDALDMAALVKQMIQANEQSTIKSAADELRVAFGIHEAAATELANAHRSKVASELAKNVNVQKALSNING